MSDRKIIAVIGATGAQGGGLVRAICADTEGGFAARAITRNPNSAKAKALAELRAEVVEADLDDAASLDAAFAGAHAAFCVTNFWEHGSPEKEIAQATAMANAAKTAGVQHAIWSTLEDTRRWVPLDDDRMPTLMGKYKVPHFDAKGESDAAFAEAGVPTTYLLTSFYWDNLIHFGMGPRPGEDGTLRLVLPMGTKRLPGIAAADIGQCAYGILQEGHVWISKRVGVAGEHLTGAEMASSLGDVLGRPVVYQAVTPEAYRGFGFPGAEDLSNMFQFKQEFNDDFCAARDVATSRQLNRSLQDFRTWLSAHVADIPTE